MCVFFFFVLMVLFSVSQRIVLLEFLKERLEPHLYQALSRVLISLIRQPGVHEMLFGVMDAYDPTYFLLSLIHI